MDTADEIPCVSNILSQTCWTGPLRRELSVQLSAVQAKTIPGELYIPILLLPKFLEGRTAL